MKKVLLTTLSSILIGFSSISAYAQNNDATSTSAIILAPNASITQVSDSSAPINTDNKINLILKNHVFTPNIINVKAEQKYTLVIENQDNSAEEFDSADLKVEQFIQPGKTISLDIGPLQAGSYAFEGEMHASAKGMIIAQ